jgi:hypothetical protein
VEAAEQAIMQEEQEDSHWGTRGLPQRGRERGFVASLWRDLSAVQAAINLPWTTSPAEVRSTDSRY